MKTLILTLLLVACISCQNSSPDESENVKKVLLDYFEGIGTRNIDKMNAATTKDFVLFEDGKVWNNDSLISILTKMNVNKIEYSFDNMKIAVDGNIGNANYFNTGNITMNDTTKLTFKWIESASFTKQAEGWKLNFLHSSVKK